MPPKTHNCKDCAHIKRIVGIESEFGVCSWFDCIQPTNKPVSCIKFCKQPTKDEQDMHDLTTITFNR